MKNFSALNRSQKIKELQSKTFDLVIIGGGITGAGVARDAISRGMSVALVEAQDFSEGTSSRSSKLIHGGIRYLENMEFHLVYEALSERNVLFQIAPHLVHPLKFLMPVYRKGRVPHWQLRLGMWLYDILALFQAPQMHEHLSKKELKEAFPYLKQKGLEGGFNYYDAYMDDDRLTLETLRSASSGGALCVNYVKALSYKKLESFVTLECLDQKREAPLEIQARHIVSAVGPWTDILGTHFYQEQWKPIMRPSKGVHLTFSKEDIPLNQAVVMGAEERIVFAIPRKNMVIVGTTDTDFSENPKNVRTQKEDVEYLLGVLNNYFPGLGINENHILSSYSGVRPLVNDGAQSEGKTSREHVVFQPFPEMTCVAGGKYTTYRKMAKDVVSTALQSFPLEQRILYKNSSTEKPLNPKAYMGSFLVCQQLKASWVKKYSFSQSAVEFFIDRHALEAESLLEISLKYLKLPEWERIWASEAEFSIENTMCFSLLDFYLRRTPLFLSQKDHGLRFLPVVSSVFSEKFSWGEKEREVQEKALQYHIESEMGWRK